MWHLPADAKGKKDKKVIKQLQTDITYLASDELEGRRTSYEGERKAADYIEKRYKEANIPPYKNQYRYPFGFVYGNPIMQIAESGMYPDPVIYSVSTPYQRIVITKAPHDLRLFLNNNLQFSTRDEYRYHEALIHPALAAIPHPKRVLILGGGDGLAAREILKYPAVEAVVQPEEVLDGGLAAAAATGEPEVRRRDGGGGAGSGLHVGSFGGSVGESVLMRRP